MSQRQRTAYTLLELLVVMAIIAVLIALFLPAVQMARETASRTRCTNNLMQIGVACQTHYSTYGRYPDGGYSWMTARNNDASGNPLAAPNQTWGWAYQILPYIEQNNVYLSSPQAAAAAVIPLYFCPSRRSPVALPGIDNGLPDGSLRGAIDYAGCGGVAPGNNDTSGNFLAGQPNNGIIVPSPGSLGIKNGSITINDITDGTSNTLLVGERNVNVNYLNQSLLGYDENDGYMDGYDWDVIRWGTSPPIPDRRDTSYYSFQFGSSHRATCLFVFGDGAVRMIHYGIDPAIFQALAARNDGVAFNMGSL